MQTHEWQALLDGATDGPWETKRHGDDLVVSICTTVHDPQHYVGYIYGEWNARLAAAAPEAVAEVVRLRQAMTRLRDDYLAHIADYDEATVTHMCYGTAADDLTRILEGDNDE